jgi:hypothetical protein
MRGGICSVDEMKLPRIDDAIERCRDHLDESHSRSTQIESFLVQHLLVLICASFEIEIERLVDDRVAKSADPEVRDFARSFVDQLFRNPQIGEIKGLLGRFGDGPKEDFKNRIHGTRAETFFSSIVNNRHQVAHSVGPNLTLAELESAYEEAHSVLDAVHAALDLHVGELAGVEGAGRSN